MSKIMITGCGSGLGAALLVALERDHHEVIPFDREAGKPAAAGSTWGAATPTSCRGDTLTSSSAVAHRLT